MITDVAKIIVNSAGKFMAKKLKICAVTVEEDVVENLSIRLRFSNNDLDPTNIGTDGIWRKVENSEYNEWDFILDGTSSEPESFNGLLIYDLDPDIRIISTGDLTGISLKNMFKNCTGITGIYDFNFTGVVSISSIFEGCSRLEYVPESFDFKTVRYLDSAFKNCKYLSKIPVIEYNKLSLSVESTFEGCERVETGMVEFYNTYNNVAKKNKKFNHSNCFTNCGTNTTEGTAEHDQIPTSWGGGKN